VEREKRTILDLTWEEAEPQVKKILADVRAELAPVADPCEDALRVLVDPDHLVELRAVNVSFREPEEGDPPPRPVSKFYEYNHIDAIAWKAAELSIGRMDRAKGIYVTLNPVKTEHGKSTKDEDIAYRRWLLIDADPSRPANTNATDDEKARAWETVGEVRKHLRERGWPEPVLADSGNGYHLLYRIDLPNDDEATGLIRRVLTALASRFDRPEVKIDRTVFNASRITKLYGTMARKGEETAERPHRASKLLEKPEVISPVPRAKLEELAAEAPEEPAASLGLKPSTNGQVCTVPVPHGPRPTIREEDLDKVLERARKYIAKVDPAVQGQNGSLLTFNAAQVLIRGFCLTYEQALPLMREYSQRCVPPWSEAEIDHKLKDAETKSRRPWGYLRNAERPVEDVTGEVDDPHYLARSFIRGQVWRYWGGSYWHYDGTRYVAVAEEVVRDMLTRHIKAEFDRAYQNEYGRYERASREYDEQVRTGRTRSGRPGQTRP
jgi:hypothetical protein